MAATDKDTIYIDIDDEITGIIDKLRNSDGKVVALVLPKRASVFQSIVNMKLLKRAADSDKKNIVLITSEAGLLPLAGAAGVHVAKTLTSKPEIPLGPETIDDAEEAIQEDGGAVDAAQPASKLANKPVTKPPIDDGVETLVLDDEDLPPEAIADSPPTPKTFDPPKKKKDKKLKVPNFERFRLILVLLVLLIIILIGGFVYANYSLAKASIIVKTDATNVNTNVDLNLSTTAKTLDESNSIVPAKLASQQKTYSQQVPTTGQKNNGNKASGTITMTAQACGSAIVSYTPTDVPAGTGVSSNGQTYITQSDTTFNSGGTLTGPPSNRCATYQANSGPTTIIAQTGGASYNGATTFSVAGRSDVSTQLATAITGGTDNIVQTVNQNDVNNAKAKISAANDATEKAALKSQLQQEQYYALDATYQAGTPNVTNSANVGDVANTVTVTETVAYTMFGAHQTDLQTLIDDNVKTQIDTSKQTILDDGLTTAVFNANNITATTAQLSMSTKAVAGPDINVTTIKQMAAGQKLGPIKSNLTSNPDVTDVTVNLSPFWVTTVPKKLNRITVTIAKPTTTASSSSSQNGSSP